MARSIILVVVALAVGAVAGYLVATDPDGGGGLPKRAPLESGAGSSGEPEWSYADPEESTPPPPDKVAPSGGFQSLSQALKAISIKVPDAGTGRISGVVLDAHGEPVQGVVIRATPVDRRVRRYFRRGGGVPEDASIEDAVRDLVRRLERSRRARLEAVSGSDGRYRIEGLSSQPYSLRAWKEEFDVSARNWQAANEAKDGDTIDFVAKKLVQVPVNVVMPGGALAESASISALVSSDGGSYSRGVSWTRLEPYVWLEPGTYDLTARPRRDEHLYKSDKVSVSVVDGEKTPTVTINLKVTLGVRGDVRPSEGERGDNVSCSIYLLRFGGGKQPEDKRVVEEGKREWMTLPRESGYRFSNVTPGTYVLGVSRDNKTLVARHVIEVRDSWVEKDLELPPVDLSGAIIVHVNGPDGKPVSGVRFRTGRRWGKSSSSRGSGRILKSSKGTYWVAHRDDERSRDKPDAVDFVTATTKGFGSKTVEYRRGVDSEVTIGFEQPARLTVTVPGYANSPLVGRLVLGVEPVGRNRGYRSSRDTGIDEAGRQEFGPLAPGEYVVTLSIKQRRWDQRRLVDKNTVVASGANAVSIAIPALHELTVIAPASESTSKRRFTLRDSNGSNRISATVDKDGRARFEFLPAGVYTVRLSGARGQMTVTLPGPNTVTFEEQKINAMLVRITRLDGSFASAGLKTGDLIVGVDGTTFQGRNDAMQFYSLASKSKSLTLDVVRGGRSMHFSVNGGAPNTWGAALSLASRR